jgi:UDP-sugar transporter A1/2/3
MNIAADTPVKIFPRSLQRSGFNLNRFILTVISFLQAATKMTMSAASKSFYSNLFSVKYGALVLLVLQNTFLVVLMHSSRIQQGPLYASSTVVLVMELLKFATCLGVVAYEKGGLQGLVTTLREEVLANPREVGMLSVPSLVYSAQNNTLYYALSHLDAATYSVGYQSKILTTALFSMFMLGKRFTPAQWLSLVILTVGVALAQLSTNKDTSDRHNTASGFIAVLMAAVMSGFAGVFFESVLKSAGTSVWVRNIQMGVSSILGGCIMMYLSGELPGILQNGFFYGYSPLVWSVIVLQAIGGLVVAVVVKVADNIMKGFAASVSVVTSCILAYVVFNDFHPTWIFFIGAVLVAVSTYMYSVAAPAPKPKTDEQSKEISLGKESPKRPLSGSGKTPRAGSAGSGGAVGSRDVEEGAARDLDI